jgi:hypothetical protein
MSGGIFTNPDLDILFSRLKKIHFLFAFNAIELERFYQVYELWFPDGVYTD